MTVRRRPQSRLGTKLFTLRRQAYLSREQVAQGAGISVDLLQSLEQGRTANPRIQTLLGLAHALMIPVVELTDCSAADLAVGEGQVNGGRPKE
jgi:transcriptional regulator with XRE-family HTH domain